MKCLHAVERLGERRADGSLILDRHANVEGGIAGSAEGGAKQQDEQHREGDRPEHRQPVAREFPQIGQIKLNEGFHSFTPEFVFRLI